jgi:hypothetical protein
MVLPQVGLLEREAQRGQQGGQGAGPAVSKVRNQMSSVARLRPTLAIAPSIDSPRTIPSSTGTRFANGRSSAGKARRKVHSNRLQGFSLSRILTDGSGVSLGGRETSCLPPTSSLCHRSSAFPEGL